MAATHPFAISGDQLAQYDQDGFVILRKQVPEGLLDSVRSAFAVAVDRLARGWESAGLVTPADEPLPPVADFDARFRALSARGKEKMPSAWRRILVTPQVHALWQRPELVGPIRSLLGDEVYAHGIWNGRPREPGVPVQQVLWHQDAHYYKGWDPADGRLVSVWIPLVPVDRTSSCLEYLPGSHTLGWIERQRGWNGLFTIPDSVLEGREPFAAEMEPGDVVLFSDTTLHRSTENNADRVRWSIDIRFAEATPALLSKIRRGYRCFSATDPSAVESFEAWAARYDYGADELVDELENFAGLDLDRARAQLAKLPDELSVY